METFQKIQNRTEWSDLLDKSRFKTFFHSLEWENFLEQNFNWLRFERYLFADQAVLSAARYKIFGREKLISHPFCEYGGPLPLTEGIDGRYFKAEFARYFAKPFQISFHPQIPRYFKDFGLKEPDAPRDTYFIEGLDKKSSEQIFSSFRKTLKHSVSKAQESGFDIMPCEKRQDLREFYRIYLGTVRAHQNIPYPFSFFEYFMKHNLKAVDGEGAEIMLAKLNGKIAAGSVFLFYGSYVHYFINASDVRYRDKGANYAVLWHQIQQYAGGLREIFDLGGTRKGSSLGIFKKGWGTKKYSIFELRNFKRKGFKKSNLRALLPLMPPVLAERTAPWLLKFKL